MARTPEGKVEDYFVEQCEANGALVRKLAYIGRRGAPDRMVVWPPEDRNSYNPDLFTTFVDFVELKAERKKPNDHQEREHKRLRDLGCNVFVIDSKEAVDNYIAMRTGR